MSDLDRYLTPEVAEKAASALRPHMGCCVDCPTPQDDAQFREDVERAVNDVLAAVLPGIVAEAKAEALESLLGRLPEIIRPYAGKPGFWEGYINAVKAEGWADGYIAGHEDARAVQPTYPQPTPNPYADTQQEDES